MYNVRFVSPHFGGAFLYIWLNQKTKPMKKLLFLLPLLAIISCDKTDTENSGDAQYNSRGCLECDNYTAGQSFLLDGIRYEVADRAILETAIDDGDDLTRYCTSRIGDMSELFFNQDINQDISSWDVSNVTTMERMFYQATAFNQDIGNWDVSNVTSMAWMFFRAFSFNQDVGSWDVSNVTSMARMFDLNTAFNQDVGNWDVSNVTDMRDMFSFAASFNQDIGSWDVSNVIRMSSIFSGASSFNQDIGNWDMSDVALMDAMFWSATAFNQDLTQWCVTNFSSMPHDFSLNSALTASNHPVWGTCP